MDCEKFDSHLIDELYDELDEVTHAAMRRHAEACARCGSALSGLRATREVGVMPLVEPSDDLEARILEATAFAQRGAPWHRKLWRGVAWAGSHAMRPQLAMAAVFVLCIGASLMLLPGGSGAPVRITERGEPAPDEAPAAVAEKAAAPTAAPPAVAANDGEEGRAEAKDKDKREDAPAEAEAQAGATAVGALAKDHDAAQRALSDARAVRSQSGCAAAVGKLDDVGMRFAGTAAAADAMWEAATCHAQLGNTGKARELYLALRGYGAYKDRADAELAAADAAAQNNMSQKQAPGGGAGSKAAAPAAPMPRAAAPARSLDNEGPAGSTPPGSTGKAPASPPKQAKPPASDATF
ncbi:MAG: zf-HC2 domain-containing protein [Polyangiaceae bacterium]